MYCRHLQYSFQDFTKLIEESEMEHVKSIAMSRFPFPTEFHLPLNSNTWQLFLA